MLSKASQHEAGACSCCPPQAVAGIQEQAQPIRAPGTGRWQKIRGGLMFAIACITSPCCTPLLVPLGLALLAGTPVAVWLSAHIGWVYAGLTLLSVASFVVALSWLNRKPSESRVHLINTQSIPIRSINGGSLMERTQSQPTETVIACDINAIAPENRDRHIEVGTQVYAAVEEVIEVPDGYAMRLPADSGLLLKIAEYIGNDRLCCSFVRFSVDIEPNRGPFWLRLTGPEGTKEYMRTVIRENNLLDERVRHAAGL